MDKKTFLTHFDDLLEKDSGTTTETDKLTNVDNWDSLAVLGFLSMVDQHFSVVLSAQSISKAQTVGDLIDLLGDKITE